MGKKKMSAIDFKKFKQEGKIFTMVTAYDYTTASIVDESEVETILVGDSLGMTMLGYNSTVGVTMEDMIHHIRPVVKGAPNTFVVGDMPFGSYNESIPQAIHEAGRMVKETGCDAIKLEGGVEFAPVVEAFIKAGVPVIGHIGLTPQTATSLGGFRVQGGTPESAKQLIADAKALAATGVLAIVVECVPTIVGKAISEAVDVPIIGIGAGNGTDAQVLVFHDMMGLYGDFKPKMVKQFCNLRPQIVRGLNDYRAECADRSFPGPEHSFAAKFETIDKLY